MMDDAIRPVPWDSEIFGVACFELASADEQVLKRAVAVPGHYTVRVNPLADKSALHRYGFYYVDTLIEPVCDGRECLLQCHHPDCTIATGASLEDLAPICRESFAYGRFHRDFNVPSDMADERYVRWLGQLMEEGEVYALMCAGRLAGFIACRGGNLVLHTLAREFRGRGLARYFWSAVCERLFDQGHAPLRSSVSAANLAVLNLYRRLGFRFDKAVDVYHGMTR